MLFRHLTIESLAYELAPQKVTSRQLEDRLNGSMVRMRLPPRPIELLTGILERGFWEPGTTLPEVAARVGRRALDAAGVAPGQVGVLLNTSVSRHFLEPSMASLVHGALGLDARCLNFDLANACLGFMNGIEVAGRMIEAGVVDYALIVDGESSREVVDATIRRLTQPEATSQDFWDNFATLTLGSASVAMVLGHERNTKTGHRVDGSVSMADTENSRLCMGTMDGMVTDSTRLLKAGVALAARTWARAVEELPRWDADDIDQFIMHQVGKSHLLAICEALRVDPKKAFLSYPTLGNVGPAAVPLTLALAEEAGKVRPGDHVALMGIGSGLNVSMMSVSW
jgi:3-oxoacyl-[acyl-carrier-protein] synthase-3